MAKCTYCTVEIPKGTGLLFVYKTGKLANFCSRKCEKHQLQLKRKAADMKWVTSRGKSKAAKVKAE